MPLITNDKMAAELLDKYGETLQRNELIVCQRVVFYNIILTEEESLELLDAYHKYLGIPNG